MKFNLDIAITRVAFRPDAGYADALPIQKAPGLDGPTPQEIRDRNAFARAGWRFCLEEGIDWAEIAAVDASYQGELEVGLLARRVDRPGLLIMKSALVVAVNNPEHVAYLRTKYGPLPELPFGRNVYELQLPLPSSNLEAFIDDQISELTSHPDLLWAEPVFVYHLQARRIQTRRTRMVQEKRLQPSAPIVTTYCDDDQWHWQTIQLCEAWKKAGTRGAGVCVAVIDRGFHEDQDFGLAAATSVYLDEKGSDITARVAFPEAAHGTMCAGLVKADAKDGVVHGAVPDCDLMLMALQETIQSTAMAAALTQCATRKARVISCAISPSDDKGWDDLKTLHTAIDSVQSMGALVVLATANRDERITCSMLESYGPLICVGPSDKSDVQLDNSRYGSGLDLLAPGEDVQVMTWDEQGGTNVCDYGGASVATPCVAGVAALVLSARPDLSPAVVVDLIAKNCSPVYGHRKGEVAWGRLNALKVVEAAMALPKPLP